MSFQLPTGGTPALKSMSSKTPVFGGLEPTLKKGKSSIVSKPSNMSTLMKKLKTQHTISNRKFMRVRATSGRL